MLRESPITYVDFQARRPTSYPDNYLLTKRNIRISQALSKGELIDEEDLRWLSLTHGSYPKVELTNKILIGSELDYVDLWHADFSGSDCTGSIFDLVSLRFANFEKTNLSYCFISDCDLRSVNFRGANLTGAIVRTDACKFQGADFTAAIMPDGSITAEVIPQRGWTLPIPKEIWNK